MQTTSVGTADGAGTGQGWRGRGWRLDHREGHGLPLLKDKDFNFSDKTYRCLEPVTLAVAVEIISESPGVKKMLTVKGFVLS